MTHPLTAALRALDTEDLAADRTGDPERTGWWASRHTFHRTETVEIGPAGTPIAYRVPVGDYILHVNGDGLTTVDYSPDPNGLSEHWARLVAEDARSD